MALLPFSCLGAKKPIGSTFEAYHAKSLSAAPLRLDDASYDELTSTPRNHSVVVLLTALEARFGCQLCRDFQPEWDLLAKSWAKGDKRGESRILLGTLDFADGKGTFQKVLELFSEPVLDLDAVPHRSPTDCGLAHVTNRSYLPLVPTNHWPECQTRWLANPLRFHSRVSL